MIKLDKDVEKMNVEELDQLEKACTDLKKKVKDRKVRNHSISLIESFRKQLRNNKQTLMNVLYALISQEQWSSLTAATSVVVTSVDLN